MRHGFERIPEKDEKIDLVSDNLGTDLLVPAQGSALESRDFEAKFAFQDLAGGACRIHFVVCQEIAVVFGPFHQVTFLIVVSDQRNVLVMLHNNFLVRHMTSLILSPRRRVVPRPGLEPADSSLHLTAQNSSKARPPFRTCRLAGQSGGQTVRHRGLRAENERDRKSTRLNSSHVSSSYAVFCRRTR